MNSNNFPKSAVTFLNKLKKNNSKEWFEDNRKLYNEELLEPAQDFVVEMGTKLQRIVPEIKAIPKIDKSIFRLHRDVRFSKDKSPYKTNLGIFFWEGERKRMECSGFYFHVEPNLFLIGVGSYMLPQELMTPFRDAVVDEELAPELLKAVKKVEKIPGARVLQQHYKKFPKGYNTSIETSKYLLYNGLHVMYETNDLSGIHNANPVNLSFNYFKKMLPIHQWLIKAIG